MIEFFFDCSSPWTYLAFHNIQPLAAEFGEEIVWKPILVGGVFNAVNPSVYASREKPVPAKAAYMLKDLQDWAREAGIAEAVTPIMAAIPAGNPTPVTTFTFTPFTPTETPVTPIQALTVTILGCNTSIDILHGMGEVTNAYVTVTNTGTTDLPNTCALLRAIDEDRDHPDKKVCVPNLPIQNQVTLKLTVDSAYNKDTIIQVDASSNDLLLLRVDRQSCTDISLFGGTPSDIGVVKPIQ